MREESGQKNPFHLSGLALAYANHRNMAKPTEEDGILTAAEIAVMDLSGVEWAVLSACDTGLGDVKAGEGVFGLRRAFQIAGARTLIMSLWPLKDEATKEWMINLYEGRFFQKQSTAEAIRGAGRQRLAARRIEQSDDHPFFWSGIVAVGDWR